MNIKGQLLCILIPLSIMPAAFCFVYVSLFHDQHPGYLILIIFSISAAAVFVGYAATKSVSEPVRQLKKSCQRLASGDLEEPVEFDYLPIEMLDLGDTIEKMRSKLSLQREQEEELVRFKSTYEVATKVAHDIRSPLSSMRAATQLLVEKSGNGPDVSDALNLLSLSGSRLETIANDLLRRHRGEGPTSKTFSIHEVLDELVGEFQASPLGRGVAFKKLYHVDALFVTGSRTGINRAIGNVLKNALEAMENNSENKPKRLIVSTSLGEGLVIRITDSGPGIPADKIPLILQGGHSEGKSNGYGIGTQVVQDVVKGYNGSFSIESVLGEGTTVILTLPSTDWVSNRNDSATMTIPYAGSAPIVVIDDDAGLREQWRLTLNGYGVETEIYTCWEDCVGGLPPHPGPLPEGEGMRTFIVDYHFDNSEVDGLEIVRRLKERGYTNLVLATAEYWKPSIKEAVQSLGVTLCPKPLPRVVVQPLSPPQCVSSLCGGPGLAVTTGSPLPSSPSGNQCGDDRGGTPRHDSVHILVLDDDPVILQTWKLQRKMWGISTTLHTYGSMEECARSDVDLQKVDLAFVDKNIDGSAWATDALIAHLKTNGVSKVWISSGEAVQDLQHDFTCAAADGIVEGKIPLEIEPYMKGE